MNLLRAPSGNSAAMTSVATCLITPFWVCPGNFKTRTQEYPVPVDHVGVLKQTEPFWVNNHCRPASSGSFQEDVAKLQLSQTPGDDNEFTTDQRQRSSCVVFPSPRWICATRKEQQSGGHTVWGDMTTEFMLTVQMQSLPYCCGSKSKTIKTDWKVQVPGLIVRCNLPSLPSASD